MAARRTERLLNLVICLLHTRSYLTAERIRSTVPGYDEAPSDEAFKRMFERDKEDLRDLGIPLETGTTSVWDDEPGYRIARRDYALPEVRLEPAEVAAVGLAARMWSSATLGAAAGRALRKLEAGGVPLTDLPEALQPRADAAEAAFPALATAVHERQAVTFHYRGAAAGEAAARTVEPWGVAWWHGRWYLVGHDRERAATRVFRLSRIVGAPSAVGPPGAVQRPADVDLQAIVSAYAAAVPAADATVRVRRDRCVGLRRLASTCTEVDAQWEALALPYADARRLVDLVLPYGADAVVVDPPDVVAEVVRRLRAVAS